MGTNWGLFSAQATLEAFSLYSNVLVLSFIFLHEFQIKFHCWLNLLFRRQLFPKTNKE